MDYKTLTDKLCERLGLTPETVASLTETMTGAIGECGMNLDSVAIPSFGTFEPRKRIERIAVHPSSGKKLMVPPKIVMNFRASQILKQRVGDEE